MKALQITLSTKPKEASKFYPALNSFLEETTREQHPELSFQITIHSDTTFDLIIDDPSKDQLGAMALCVQLGKYTMQLHMGLFMESVKGILTGSPENGSYDYVLDQIEAYEKLMNVDGVLEDM